VYIHRKVELAKLQEFDETGRFFITSGDPCRVILSTLFFIDLSYKRTQLVCKKNA
jgi:hypothetical protein